MSFWPPLQATHWHREGDTVVIDRLELIDHPALCTGCPDCMPFWMVDREPIPDAGRYRSQVLVELARWRARQELPLDIRDPFENFVRSFAPGSHGVRLFPDLPPEHARNGLDFRNSPRVAEERSSRHG